MHTMSFLARPVLRRLAAVLLVAAPLLSACNTEPSYVKQARELTEAQKAVDDATIQTYLTRHNITDYTRTSSGLYLVKVTDGPASNPLITKTKNVTVNYVGKFIYEANDGAIFENSSDNRTTCGCRSFTAGANTVIAGWEEAILLMRKGDRKLLLVPSGLAYGVDGLTDSSSGQAVTVVPAYTPLLYDLEVTNVQ